MNTAKIISSNGILCNPDSRRRLEMIQVMTPATKTASDVVIIWLNPARDRLDKLRNARRSSSLSEDAAMAANLAACDAFVCASMLVSNDTRKHTIARR